MAETMTDLDRLSPFAAMESMNMDENVSVNLLPCPFCGGEAVLDNLIDQDDFFVSCKTCEVQQIANYRGPESIRRWNTRVSLSTAPASPPFGEEANLAGVKIILSRIVGEMTGCTNADNSLCDLHAVNFDHKDFEAAKNFLGTTPRALLQEDAKR